MSEKPHFGSFVKAYRLEKLWPQVRLAKELGISLPTLKRLEATGGCSDLTRAKIEQRIGKQKEEAA